jgi:transcriptional regulator with XRE-family HTH domain
MSEMKDRLKELRKTLNLKQREVAERLDVAVSVVGGWEAGVQAIPSTRIYQLCKEYNVRREWLETGVGEMFEPEATFEEKLANAASALFDGLSIAENRRAQGDERKSRNQTATAQKGRELPRRLLPPRRQPAKRDRRPERVIRNRRAEAWNPSSRRLKE